MEQLLIIVTIVEKTIVTVTVKRHENMLLLDFIKHLQTKA